MGKTISGVFTVRWGAEKGDKGDGGLSVQLSPTLMSFPADTAGIPTGTPSFTVTAEIFSGGERQAITSSSLSYSDSSGYEVSMNKTTTCITISGRIKNKAFTNDNPWIDITLISAKGAATARFNIILQRQGADGKSVIAQYSSDGSTWHSNYISGDVWMRTSSDSGRTWSAAVRIVGEKGDGGAWTDYSYNTSSQLTTSNVNSAPSDISTWYDAPIAPSGSKPYLWMRVQRYSDETTKEGLPTYLRMTGEKGADGTSVNIKGYVNGWAADAASIVTNHKLTQWAIDEPHGLYVPFTETQKNVGDGDGYLIKADPQDEPSDNEGHLIVSSGGIWLDCGKITGEKGDDGKTMYLHIAYSDSADGSENFTTDDDMSGERSYIGTYADFVQKDSEMWQDYHWMRNKGDKGDKGDNALYIVCDGEGETYPADADGYATKNSTHTVTAELFYGTEALTDYAVVVSSADDENWYTVDDYNTMAGDVYISSITRSGTKCIIVFVVGESNYTDNNAYIRFRMSCSYGVREKQINCYANKQGETGKRGAVLRGPQAWEDCAVGYSFQAGGDGEEYKDIVTYKGYYYSCMTAHRKTAGNAPLSTADTSGGLWKLADSVEMVATKILLSEYALVKNLGVETVEMKDAAGNVVFRVKDGAVTCKTGTFENVEISGTLTEGTVQIDGSSLYNWLTPGKSVYAVGTDGMKSVTINNPCGNLVCLPTYNGFTDKVYEWDGNFEGAELEREFLRVPSFTKGGTHLTLQTGTVKGTEGWAALPESKWETLSHYFGNMMEHCVLICADPQTLVRAEGGTSVVMPSHVWNGQSPNTGAASNGYYGYGHGRFSYKGAIGRFVVLLPGQHLHLISAVETVRNSKGVDEQCLVWHIENAADFAPVAMRMYVNDSAGVYYEDFPSGTTNLDMVDGGVDYWQDMLFAPPILDVKRNGAGYDSGIVQLTVLLGGVDTKYPLPRLVFY